ncbi:hypothetical protein Bhz51_00061 [Stenotrophomonas phage vB_SmaM_Bhz51]|nr:hypothetical protein [Stenotrophomonas phage BUCT608]QYC97574.1 hypothetical protein [Stenotrophomonas phage BUCT608]QYW02610.1 hypothetical protein CPT_Marzo_068 [Stenotrophomonas phage Marzo]
MKDPLIEIPKLAPADARELYFSTEAYVWGYNAGIDKFSAAYGNPAKYGTIYTGFTVPKLELSEYTFDDSKQEEEFTRGFVQAVAKLYVLNYSARSELQRLQLAFNWLTRESNLTRRFSQTTGQPDFVELKFTLMHTHNLVDEVFSRSLQDLEMQLYYSLHQKYGLNRA